MREMDSINMYEYSCYLVSQSGKKITNKIKQLIFNKLSSKENEVQIAVVTKM